MHARDVEDAATRLRDLRREEWGQLGLAALSLGLAVGITWVYPPLAVPLLLGGLVVLGLGVETLWRRWDLVERLSGEPDAYLISEVKVYALREATMERRQSLAAMIRNSLREPGPVFEARISAAAEELEALASELDARELELEPACAVACVRLLSDFAESPLLNATLRAEDLRSQVCQIRSGFRPASVG